MSEKKEKKQKKPQGTKLGIFEQILIAVLVFAAISGIYSVIVDSATKSEAISLSQVATMMNTGQVKDIVVKGDDLDITATDGTLKTSKK
jgi:hypothetical protein